MHCLLKESVHDFGLWQGRLTDSLVWYTDDGWENKASVDMERLLSRRWFFRVNANLYWFESEDGLPHSLIFQFYHVLTEHKALLYENANIFDTEPSHKMTDLQFRVAYRQRFYRDWLVKVAAVYVQGRISGFFQALETIK